MATATGEDAISFSDPDRSACLKSSMREMQIKGQLTDIVLESGGVSISCHRVVLAASSSYFKVNLLSEVGEWQSGIINMDAIDSCVLEAIVQYMYTSTIEIDTDNVHSIIKASSILNLDTLKDKAAEFLQERIKPSSCIGIYEFADEYALFGLKMETRKMISKQFLEVAQGDEFLDMDAAFIKDIISSPDLLVENENPVFDAVVKWLSHDKEIRMDHHNDLIARLKLPYCTHEFLSNRVAKHPMMQNEIGQKLYTEASNFKMQEHKQHEIHTERTIPRKSYSPRRQLLCIGGMNPEQHVITDCVTNSKETSCWTVETKLPWKQALFSACITPAGVFVSGVGKDRKDCWIYDKEYAEWFQLRSMERARLRHGSVFCGQRVFMFGGVEDDKEAVFLSSVDIYDMKTRKWNHGPEMPLALIHVMVVTLGCNILVFGGQKKDLNNDDTISCSTFALDPAWQSWTTKADMPEPCSFGAAVTLNEKVYAVGGFNRSCLCYDALQNTWAIMFGPQEIRADPGAVVWQGKIFLTGGRNYNTKFNTAEVYDPERDVWYKSTLLLKHESSYHFLFNI